MKTKKRVLSLLLSGVMTLSLLPSAAFAVEAAETQEQPAVVVDDTQASSANDSVSVTSDADDSEASTPEASNTKEIDITWARTSEKRYSERGLDGLIAGDKTDYQKITGNTASYSWDWSDISQLKTPITDGDKIWDYNTTNQYTDANPENNALGIKPVDGIFAATWNNRVHKNVSIGNTNYQRGDFDNYDADNESGRQKSYTVRKISGTFQWPAGYDLSDNIELVSVNDDKYSKIYNHINENDELKEAFGGKKVLAINDDVYAFIYKEGTTLTADNYDSYMAFFTGTAGQGVWSNPYNDGYNWGGMWQVTTPATYKNTYAVQAFKGVYPNRDNTTTTPRTPIADGTSDGISYLNQSDGWYSFMDGNSLTSVLENQYGNNNVSAGDTFHIDFYCFDTDKVGGMDKLKLQITKKEKEEVNVTVRYWLDDVGNSTSDDNYLGSTIMTNQKVNSQITLIDGTDTNQLNYKKAAATTKNNGYLVKDGVQQTPPFTVTENENDNIIDVVYKPTTNVTTATYTYDFGVKNSYSNLLSRSGFSAQKWNVSVPDSQATYVKYNSNTDTITYTPQTIQRSESVRLSLDEKGGSDFQILDVRFLPETNVLYEETFMTNSGDSNVWATVGNNDSTTVTDNGAGSVYGYTKAYDKDSNGTFSNGSAYMASLMLLGDATSVRTEADKTFTFSGTGFDLISECGTNTGMLIVGVKNTQTNEVVKGYIVDTYFSGDNNEETGSIISGEGILAYQIPVVRAMDLPRGKYEVTVRGYITESAGAIVNKGFDNIARTKSAHTSKKDLAKAILRDAGMEEYCKNVELSYMDDNSVLNGGTGAAVSTPKSKNAIARTSAANRDNAVQVYIDGFRVYQPRSDESSYVDREKGLNYHSIYDYLTANEDPYTETDIANSAVYVETDGDINSVNGNPATIETYKEKGPENEVYLTTDNFVGFALEDYNGTGTVMVSAKSINDDATLSAIKNGRIQEVKDLDECGTEMYYDVTKYVFKSGDKYYLILGNGEDDENSVLSISGIKLPKGTTSTSSAETSNAIAKMVSLAYQEDTTFAPKYFKVHAKSKVKAGKRTTIKATASTTADHIAIYTNSKCTKPVSSKTKAIQPDNKKAVRKGTAKRYTFHASVKIAKRQKYNYYVVAYDKNGKASDPVKVSITGKR